MITVCCHDGGNLPVELTVRYRVEYIPVPADNFFAQDVNDLGFVAGWYREPDGEGLRDVGFLYDFESNVVPFPTVAALSSDAAADCLDA